MDIFTTTSHLKSKLSEIGLQLEAINSTDDNANVANTAGSVTYLLTSNSKNQTLKTVGGLTSIAAILYGSSERRKSNRIKMLYKQNILDLVGYIANFDSQIFFNKLKRQINDSRATGENIIIININRPQCV